jgi:hypothetical protein
MSEKWSQKNKINSCNQYMILSRHDSAASPAPVAHAIKGRAQN